MSTVHDLWRRVTARRHASADARRADDVTVEAVPFDPMHTLAVQVRLAELAEEVRRIEADPDVYAKAHHWRAAVLAYDALLRDACVLAGVEPEAPPLPVDADAPRAREARLREELDLASRGWSW